MVPAARFNEGKDFPLPVNSWPITLTFIKLRDLMLVDPTLVEELSADARLTVSLDEKDHIRAMQKGLKGSLTYDDVVRALDTAQNLSSGIRSRLISGE